MSVIRCALMCAAMGFAVAGCGSDDPTPSRADAGDLGDVAADETHEHDATSEPDEGEPDAPVVSPCPGWGAVFINEVSASNASIIADEDGDWSDWIELYNASRESVSLLGWGLSDDPRDPFKWVFSDVAIGPRDHLVVFASGKDRPAIVEWDTRVDWGDEWRYLPVTEPPPADWMSPSFDDSDWETGPSGFGRGDDDDATVVDAHTIYVRTRFSMTEAELDDLVRVFLHVDYDDGFVAYINGEEVLRRGFTGAFVPLEWDAFAQWLHEAKIYRGIDPSGWAVANHSELLGVGENVLAIEVHDQSDDSSDLTLIPFLTLGFSAPHGGELSDAVRVESAIHTSYRIAVEGETLTLTAPDRCELDRMPAAPGHTDESRGRSPDGGASIDVFVDPTPGEWNATESYDSFAAEPVITPEPGFYRDGVTVDIRVEGDSEAIRYTLDGSEPDENDRIYVDPIRLPVSDRPYSIRARSFDEGRWPSRVATATYFTRDPRPLPAIALVVDPHDLWDDETGIHTFGDDFDEDAPFDGANFHEDWERPAHFAFWEPDGTLGFAIDGGAQIHGDWTRAWEQKSWRLIARDGYGTSEILHPVFGAPGVSHFSRLVIRNGGNDWFGCFQESCEQGSMLRDSLVSRIAQGTGLDRMRARPAVVYLDDEYWGLYVVTERPDKYYFASHHGVDPDAIDIVEDWGAREERYGATEGDTRRYRELFRLVVESDLSDDGNLARLGALMELDNFAAYQIVNFFANNRDWPWQNVRMWRPRTPSGRWRWILHDLDQTLGIWDHGPDEDTLANSLWPDAPRPMPFATTLILRKLLENETFRRDFINRYADYLNTLFRPERTQGILWSLVDEVRDEMPRHNERWGHYERDGVSHTMPEGRWDQEIATIDAFLAERPGYVRQHIVDNFDLAGTYRLRLETLPQGEASFQLTAATVEAPFEGTYFVGVPVTVTVVPRAGRTFGGWQDASLGDAATVVVDSDGELTLTAIIE